MSISFFCGILISRCRGKIPFVPPSFHKEQVKDNRVDRRMDREIAFLNQVEEKLKVKIEELNRGISQGQKEIEDMHEYYWENYTEMDEYGYENFDNQQALFQQVTANQQKQKLRHRLERMQDSPYFGRVDFVYDGEEEAETFYIGIGNFAERPGSLPLIYDWRAPVSSLFYDYDKGPAFYEAPAGKMDGAIREKWQYKIKGGTMVYAFESDIKIDDEILKQELGSHGDVQLKNIVRTIQKEQNAIIRNRKDKILVIQGTAGSGKTSVALHRIAYLLYHDRKNLKSSNILVLSPNSVFSDYISHILPELGEENIQEMSFDLFAYRELKDTVIDCEDRYDQLETKLNRPWKEPLPEEARWKAKQSQWFVGQTEGFLAQLEDRIMNFRRIEWKGMEKSEQELIQLFYFQFADIPLMNRMEAVMERFIDEYETLHRCELSEEDRAVLENKFMGMYETRDLYVIYNWLMEALGYETLPEAAYEKRVLEYEDVYPMLYLKYRLFGKGQKKQIRHLVIDEMQDYSYLQYVILKMLFPCNMTILGDWAQTMDDEVQDVKRFLPKIFGKGIRMIEMKKSYRNTVEIARYAAKLIGNETKELFERHGKEVEECRYMGLEEAVQAAADRLNLKEGGMETAAILTLTEAEAKKVCQAVKQMGVEVTYIDRNSSSFKKGLTVTTFYLAKGLEFDQIFAIMPNRTDALAKQAGYICATRALHELYMYQYQ